MATVSIALDRRAKNTRGAFPIRLWIRNANTSASISTGISCTAEQYDGRDPAHTVVSTLPNARAINDGLLRIYAELQQFVLDLTASGQKNLTANEIKNRFEKRVQAADADANTEKNSFSDYFLQFSKTKIGKYVQTFNYTAQWLEQFHAEKISFDELDFAFLQRFDNFLKQQQISANSRGIIFRNMRTVLNDAINNELTDRYPFRKFKIPHAVKDKEYLELDDFRRLLAYQPTTDGTQAAKDLFLLSFYFCGANPIDLFNMPAAENGCIRFVRTKTQSKSQSTIKIRIQPEAAELVARYAGRDGYLLNFRDHYMNYENFYHFMGKKIRAVAAALQVSGLSFYWARYSWATYASRIGTDESVIGRALGHAPTSLAGRVYITFDWQRVDDANRRVIDYLNEK